MYYNSIQGEFSSAHRLSGYDGSCEKLHGHNFKVRVVVCGESLNDLNLLVDFRHLKSILAEILDELDHRVLNELDCFKELNPTAEVLSKYIYDRFSEKIRDIKNISVHKVVVGESDRCEAFYKP